MSCNHTCRQGRSCTCAIVAFYAETEGVMPMVTGCSFKALPDPAKQPLPPIEPPSDKTDQLLHLGRWISLTFAVMATAAATAVFFTKG